MSDLGLVVASSNGLVKCPHKLSGVPITDELIWKKFFEGEYQQMVRTTDSGQLKAQSIFKLYYDERDAAKRIVIYLNDPPQLSHYKHFITARIHQ